MARRIRSNVLWAGTGRILSISFLFALHSAMAHLLSPEDYGRYLLLESVTLVLSMLILAGLPGISLRMLRTQLASGNGRGAADVVKTSLWIMSGTALMIATGVFIFALLAGNKVLDGMLWRWLPCILTWAAAAALLRIMSELARGYDLLGYSYLVGGQSGGFGVNGLLLLSVLAVGAINSEIPLFTMLCIQIVIQLLWVVPALTAVFAAAGEHSVRLERDSRKPAVLKILQSSLPLLIQQLVGFGLPEADTMMLGAYSTADDIAFYGAAKKLVLLAVAPLMLVSHAIQPFIIDLYAAHDTKRLTTLVRGTATFSAVFSLSVLLVFVVAPDQILRTLFGEAYLPATTSLRVLCVGAAAFALTGPCGLVLTMTGHEKAGMWSSLAVATLYLIVAPFLIARFGILGAAAGSAGLQCILNVSLLLLVFYHERFWTGVTLSATMLHSCFRVISPAAQKTESD